MTVTKLQYDGQKIYDVSGIGYAPEGMITDDSGGKAGADGVLKRLLLSGLLCSDAVIYPREDGKYACIGILRKRRLLRRPEKAVSPKMPQTRISRVSRNSLSIRTAK